MNKKNTKDHLKEEEKVTNAFTSIHFWSLIKIKKCCLGQFQCIWLVTAPDSFPTTSKKRKHIFPECFLSSRWENIFPLKLSHWINFLLNISLINQSHHYLHRREEDVPSFEKSGRKEYSRLVFALRDTNKARGGLGRIRCKITPLFSNHIPIPPLENLINLQSIGRCRGQIGA